MSKVTVETITPERSRQILTDSAPPEYNYRNASAKTIDRYALDMVHNRWQLTGEAIKFDKVGNLVDGQHRLLACIKANVSFTTYVIRDIDENAVIAMDWGRKRSLADVLRRAKEVNVLQLSAAINLSWAWEVGDLNRSASPGEALIFLNRNPLIRDAVRKGEAYTGKFQVPPAASGAFTFKALSASEEAETDFRQKLLAGSELKPGDPIQALFHWLTLGQGAKGSVYRPDRISFLAIFVKTWNAYLLGKSIRNLAFRRGGPRPESFPAFLVPENVTEEGE